MKSNQRSNRSLNLIAGLVGLMLGASVQGAFADENEWRFSLIPYLWLPTIDGSLAYDVPSRESGAPTVSVGPSDWLEALDYGLLLTGEARKNRVVLFSDFIALGFSADESTLLSVTPASGAPIQVGATLDAGTDVDIDGLLFTGAVGYNALQDDGFRADVFAGVRYFHVETTLNWRATATIALPDGRRALSAAGTFEQEEDILDGIVGVRGEIDLGDSAWSIPFHLDVGAGTSELTWQAAGGLAYGFENWDLIALYRHLAYDQSDDELLQDFSFSGPAIAARFRF